MTLTELLVFSVVIWLLTVAGFWCATGSLEFELPSVISGFIVIALVWVPAILKTVYDELRGYFASSQQDSNPSSTEEESRDPK
jgi:hypothetical protein